VQQLKQQFEES